LFRDICGWGGGGVGGVMVSKLKTFAE